MSYQQALPAAESQTEDGSFINRRKADGLSPTGAERRQFNSSYSELSPEGAELGEAVDRYKLNHRRRFVTYDEILEVLASLGYSR